MMLKEMVFTARTVAEALARPTNGHADLDEPKDAFPSLNMATYRMLVDVSLVSLDLS